MFGANKSTAWIEFELLVRDYYKFYALLGGGERTGAWGCGA